MHLGVAADHTGFQLKTELTSHMRQLAHQVTDFGPAFYQPNDDYPDHVAPLAEAVAHGIIQRGIAICGSGVGASVVANKIPGVRAGICHDVYSARQGVEHDDMNVLVLGARVVGLELARTILNAFLQAHFSGEDRHCRRLRKLAALEARYRKNPT